MDERVWFGVRLRELREQSGLTATELAVAAGVDAVVIHDLEQHGVVSAGRDGQGLVGALVVALMETPAGLAPDDAFELFTLAGLRESPAAEILELIAAAGEGTGAGLRAQLKAFGRIDARQN